jgi:hypothetical protein
MWYAMQWTGTCIGARNYSYFFLFICSILATAVFMLVSVTEVAAGWAFEQKISDFYMLRGISCVVFTAWGLFVGVLVGLLLLFHVYLVVHGQTTHEFLRSRSKRGVYDSKYHSGIIDTITTAGSMNARRRSASCYSGRSTTVSTMTTAPSPSPSGRLAASSFDDADDFGVCCTVALTCLFPYPTLLLPMWKNESNLDAELDLVNAEETMMYLRDAL